MIEKIIAETFAKIGHKWRIGGKLSSPSEDDVLQVLDTAAERLYNEDVGDRLETGGLIIEKQPRGHDVYMYVGHYL